MANYGVKIDSKALNKQLSKALKQNPVVTAKKVTAITLDLAGRSARLAPVDTGDLRNNCTAAVNDNTVFSERHQLLNAIEPCTKVSATVGYSLPYALRQHENLIYNHPMGGEAKFLEKPFNENEQRYIDALKSIPEEVFK